MVKPSDGERSWLLWALVGLLLLSLGLHAVRWVEDLEDERAGVETVRERTDPHRFLVDFDRPMVGPDEVDRGVEAGLLSVEPQTRIAARFVTTRRLEIRFPDGAPRFQELLVRFAPSFEDAAGEPLRSDAPLRLTTGQLELVKAPVGAFHTRGVARVVPLTFNGTVHARDLLRHLRTETVDGAPIEHDVRGSGRRWEVEIPADAPGTIRLILRKGLTSSVGPRGLAGTIRTDVTWPLALKLVDVEARRDDGQGIVELAFSHGLVEQDLESYVEVEPRPDDLEMEVDGRTVRIRGAFPSRARITVRARAGVRARSGASLEATVERRVVLPRARPRIAFLDRGSVFSARALPVVDVEGVNVPTVEVQIRRVHARNVVPFALGWVYAGRAAGAPAVETLEIDAGEDEVWTRPLDLEALLGEKPLGVYHVELEAKHPAWRSARRLLQITDLAPTVRVADAGVVIFVRRVSDATAVDGATVALYDAKNRLLAEGRTDREGLLVVTEVSGEPYVVTAAKGDDLAYVEMDHHRVAHRGSDIQGRPPARGLEVRIVSDRGAVRPGETAHLTGLVRDASGRAAREGLPIHLEVLAPDGRTWRKMTRRVDAHGMFALDLPFRGDDPTGAWRVRARWPGAKTIVGRAAFRVAAIVPDRIEPFVDPVPAGAAHGARVEVSLGARLPNGRPTPGLRVKLRVRYRAAKEGRAPVSGYAFGDETEAPEPFTVDVGEGALDAQGRFVRAVELPALGRGGIPLRATFEAEVIDVSGRAAFARRACVLAVARPRLGIAAPAGSGDGFRLALAGAEEAEGAAVLERLRWSGAWELRGGRRVWRSRRSVVRTWKQPFRVHSGRGKVVFPALADGEYRVRVEAEGVVPAGLAFSRWDGSIQGGAEGKGAPRLVVRALGAAPRIGEEARVQVETPFGGTLLLTVEAPSLLVARATDVVAGTHDLRLPWPALEGPGAHVTATLIRGASLRGDGAARLLGACWIPTDRPERRLDLQLDVPPRVEPERDLIVGVRTDGAATVRVLAVDEGVLRLTGHRVPDPAAFFGARRALETRVADAWARLALRQRFGGEDAEAGGGHFASRLDPTARKTIETVALASALVHVDGEAEVRLPLPAWEGKLRVVAIAAGREGTGAASKPVLVEGPISVEIYVPRAAAPGDLFDATIAVRGDGVRWDLALDGLERVEGEGVRLRVLDAVGVASLTVRAEDAAGHAMERVARLRVRPPAPFTVEHRVHTVKAGETLEPGIDGRWADGRKVVVSIGAVADMVALPAIERLLEYPYGCVEQTVSRAFPVLAWAGLWERRLIDRGRPEDVVDAAVARLQNMQIPAGGFAMWPGGDDAYPFGTTYAVDFLLEAKRRGRPVPERMLDDAVRWLAERGKRDDAYVLLVLARAGKPVRADLDRLSKLLDDAEAEAQLAAGYLHLGATAKAEALLEDLGDPWKAPRDTGLRLRSPVRAAATVLRALAACRPDDARIDDLALRLRHAASDAAGRTTQENAAALLALAAVSEGRGPGNSAGMLEIDGRREAFRGERRFELGRFTSLRVHAERDTTLVLRVEGHRLDGLGATVERGLEVRRTIEGLEEGRLRQGEVYRVVLEGTLHESGGNVLLQDLLPGGLEIEKARGQAGTFRPDRIEPRDDRVLFFRTKRTRGPFRQTYLVRAVTPGTYRVPPVAGELLYAPEIRGRASGGGTLEIVR